MKLLLDTHVLLWALADDPHLPVKARRLIEDVGNDIYYSVVCPWEVQVKHSLHPSDLLIDAKGVVKYCEMAGFRSLPVKITHVLALGDLQCKEGAVAHKDPFDRIMVCQASAEKMLFVTHDRRIADYTDPAVYPV